MPTGQRITHALLCASEKIGQQDSGKCAFAASCPCAKEVLNIVADKDGKFRFGAIMHKRGKRKLVIFKRFAEALKLKRLPIYLELDIYNVKPSKIASLFSKRLPVISGHLGMHTLGSDLKNAWMAAASLFGIAAIQLEKLGFLATGIGQFLSEHGISPNAVSAAFGTLLAAAFIGVAVKDRQKQHDAKCALYYAVEGERARQADKKNEKPHAKENHGAVAGGQGAAAETQGTVADGSKITISFD
ncbi:MAG: hypothetical protein WCY41_03630 [Candidatus Micrarchaeia archaeon]